MEEQKNTFTNCRLEPVTNNTVFITVPSRLMARIDQYRQKFGESIEAFFLEAARDRLEE